MGISLPQRGAWCTWQLHGNARTAHWCDSTLHPAALAWQQTLHRGAAAWRHGLHALAPLTALSWLLSMQVAIDVGDKAAPRSAHDAFVLSAARARASAILTTGANVRAEPRLTHEPFGVGAEALREWRSALTGGVGAPAHTLVLTRDASLDLTHPLFSGGHVAAPAHILTDRPAALALRRQSEMEQVAAHVVEMQGRALSHPTSPIVYARSLPHPASQRSRGATTKIVAAADVTSLGSSCSDVLIECGVTTARPLYVAAGVDELMLTVYRGPLAASARGKAFLSWDEICGYFGKGALELGVARQYSVKGGEEEGRRRAASGGGGGALDDDVPSSWSFLRFRRSAMTR
jgi:riboflavin biosynthesis pyrimidine reductase